MWSFFKMIVWGILWFLLGLVFIMIRKTNEDNCLTWAMREMDEKGGYLVIRWARSARWRWLKWPHFLWLDDKHEQHLRHFIPHDKDNADRYFPKPWFKGYIKLGDKDKE